MVKFSANKVPFFSFSFLHSLSPSPSPPSSHSLPFPFLSAIPLPLSLSLLSRFFFTLSCSPSSIPFHTFSFVIQIFIIIRIYEKFFSRLVPSLRLEYIETKELLDLTTSHPSISSFSDFSTLLHRALTVQVSLIYY